MTEEDLPSPVDALVVGTAFAEAAVAAALARAGDRVLHVDRNAYYGGSGAGFSLEKLQAWAAERTERAESRADEEVGVQLTAADRAATGLCASRAAPCHNPRTRLRTMTALRSRDEDAHTPYVCTTEYCSGSSSNVQARFV